MSVALLDFEGLAEACTAGSLAAFGPKAQLGWTLSEATRQAHFGVRYASNLPMRPSHLWPELERWYKALARNRKRLAQWAASAEGVVSVARAPRHDSGDEAGESSAEATGAELLAAIIAEPDDRVRRMVYADWLVSRGDAQGELIALCERRRSQPDPTLDARITELVQTFGARIAGELAQLAKNYSLEHGFVSRFAMSAPSFAKHGARLLAAHPIRRLDLAPVSPKSLARLARADALRGLRGLHIGQIIGRTRPMPFDELCASPHFDMLESLEVWTWETSGDPEAAFAGLRAPSLRRLMLWQVDSAPAILAGLAANESVVLHELSMHLRRSPRWPALTGPAFAELRRLKVDASGPGVAGLFEGAGSTALVDLELDDDFPVERLAIPSLRRLALGRCELDEREFGRLLDRHPRLEGLRIYALQGLSIDRLLELALALRPDHPLAALELRTHEASPELVARAKQRFARNFYDLPRLD